ncbi:MAG: acetylornithine transaminase [Mariprofundaceae bacterium]|nr:acetylornithine transaminase [Mariprofundaceae bacterium]
MRLSILAFSVRKMNHVMQTYARLPLTLVRGKGSYVVDDNGKQYLDFVAGIAVNTLGHAHPMMVEALHQQAQEMLHCSNLYHIPKQIELAGKLAELSGLDEAFFCNSGAEANEAAIKISRKYFYDAGSNRRTIISATNSFHGRLLSTLTATGQDKVKVGFDPLPTGFKHVPLNDLSALRHVMDSETAAVLLEPLQGEGGVNLAAPEYLQAVRKLCDEQGVLLILDEVQTGIGRTGAMFAFEHAGIRADVITLAKGLGGGLPIGVLLASAKVASAFSAGTHGSTFGGNPLSCTAALTVLQVIKDENILKNVQARSEQLCQGLTKLIQRFDCLTALRGQGLLLGLLCSHEVAPVVDACRHHGLLVLSAGTHVLRMLPPLNVSESEVAQALIFFEKSLNEVST